MRAAIALAAALLSACSGLKTYPNDLPKNLTVQTKTSSGSVLQSVYVSLSIHTVDAKCQTDYKGTVALAGSTTQVGIPTQGPVYLEFVFDRSGFLSSSRSSIDYGIVLRARPAHQYAADVSYDDGLYKVTLRDRSAGNVVVERQLLESCSGKG